MWIWQKTSPKDLIAVARGYAITQLLVWVPPGFTANQAELAYYKALRASTHAAKLQLDALGGDPSWAEKPQIAAAWAAEVRESGLFVGLHLDIEPYALASWRDDPVPLVHGLLAVFTAATATGMSVDADIPYWYETVKAAPSESLDVAVMRTVSSVTIMAYRNTAAGVLSVAGAEMAHAAELGKSAWIGVNIAEPGGDPPSTTFYGDTASVFNCAINAINTEARRWSAFSGISVQDYQGLAALVKRSLYPATPAPIVST